MNRALAIFAIIVIGLIAWLAREVAAPTVAALRIAAVVVRVTAWTSIAATGALAVAATLAMTVALAIAGRRQAVRTHRAIRASLARVPALRRDITVLSLRFADSCRGLAARVPEAIGRAPQADLVPVPAEQERRRAG